MAAKNKHKKKHTAPKTHFTPANGADEDELNGEYSGEHGEDSGEDGEGPGNNRNTEKDEFNLEEVLRLGGTQADFVLLAGLDENNELIDGGKKGAIDDLEEGELDKFITKLGIRQYASLQIIADEEEAPAPKESKDIKTQKSEKQSDKQQKEKEKKSHTLATKSSDKTLVTSDTKPKDPKKLKSNTFEFTKRSILLIKPGGKWFDSEYSSEFSPAPQDTSLVAKYKTLAQQLLENEVEIYRSKKNLQKGANSTWMKTVVSAGVLADRMAAMTVLIQDAPVHSLEHFENLVAMVKKKGSRRMGLMAMDTIRELVLSDLLPENRKLRSFNQHPFDELEEKVSGNKDSRDRRLVLWLFEHQLKHHFAEFVATLETVAHDTVATTKMKALMTAFELLGSRPEQEKALLMQIVNKLGDPEYKLAAKTSYLLEKLLHKHPNMKAVVCCEVERLMFRANVGAKAQYYAACFLSQVILSHADADLAAKLIGIYFSFFRACVKRKEVESRMLSALLTGVNRAYPFAAEGDEAVKEQMDTVFKVVHVVKFNTAVQALMLLFQVMDSQQSVSDRYYGALYRKLLDPSLSSSSRQSMFLNLLYKSIKADTVLRRVKAFVKRLLQVCSEQNSSFICGALFLISELLKNNPALRTMIQEQGDGEEEIFKDLPDEEEEPQSTQAPADEEEESQNTQTPADEEEDDEEHFVDADKSEAGEPPEEHKPAAASWVHHQNIQGGKSVQSYDPLHRNPLFCGADHTCLWELHTLAAHFHPSVSLFAKTILQGDSVQYSGDPLQDFTLIRFLDRFVFRNPKQLKGKQDTDSMKLQPKHKKASSSLPVNCEEFLSKDESQIPVDEVFFHRFFRRRQQEQQTRRPRPEGDTDSIQDVDDDEFEKILDSCEGDSYYAQFKDDDLDFAGSVSRTKEEKGSDSEDEEDMEDMEDLDDEEVELSLDEEDFGDEVEEEGGAFMDPDEDEEVPELEEDEAGFENSDEEEMEEELSSPQKKKTKRKHSEELDFAGLGPKGAKKKRGKKESSMFASAEEFGSLLDENAGLKFDNVGLNAMRNTDRAGLKQLKWETQRDDWIHDRDVKTLRRKKSTFNRNRKQFRPAQTGNRKNSTRKNRK